MRAKTEILRDALTRIGGLELSTPPPMTPSPRPYAYRNRTRVLMTGDGVGYRRRRSHRLCAVDRCPVLEPVLEQALARMSRRAATPPGASEPGPAATGVPDAEAVSGEADEGAEWELALGSDGEVRTAPVSGSEEGTPSSVCVSRHLDRQENERRSLLLRYGRERIAISPGVFAQGNAHLLEALSSGVVGAACGEGRGTRGEMPAAPLSSLVELFSGAGFLTLPLARRFDRVVFLRFGQQGLIRRLRSRCVAWAL